MGERLGKMLDKKPMKREGFWGVIVSKNPIVDTTYDSRGNIHVLVYPTYISKFRKSGNFVTTPEANKEIRNLVSAGRLKQGYNLGFVTYWVDDSKKEIVADNFYPLGEVRTLLSRLKGKGLGSMIERIMIKDLSKRFPEHNIMGTSNPENARKKQYRMRGRTDPEARVPVKEELTQLEKAIKKGNVAARKKRRRK